MLDTTDWTTVKTFIQDSAKLYIDALKDIKTQQEALKWKNLEDKIKQMKGKKD